MRKSLIALCVAGALTAPMIAQADANLLMAQPALFFQLEVSQAQPVTLTAEVPATENRSMVSQPEAVVIMASESETGIEVVGMAKPINEGVTGDGPFERGWQS
jgi:hypothetical protein